VNLDLSRSLGADDVVDYTREDFARNGQHYDVILDAAGTAPFSRIEFSLAPHGRFVPVLGSLSDLLMSPWVNATSRRKIVSGVIRPQAMDLLLLQALASSGEYRAVIDRRFKLDQIVEAHRYVDTRRKKGSVVVTLHNTASTD
jgi:NADPH:quinone reductase-like Zn-dependent oxidoreductase